MAGEDQEALLAQARALDDEAIRVGEHGSAGRELRARAAELRRQALGERVYPVLVCTTCFHLTGWTTAAGDCDPCARRSLLRAAYADPHGGFVANLDARVEPALARAPLKARLPHIGKGSGDRSRVTEWLRLVAPDETGPIDPEDGYEVEVAHRQELVPVEGDGVLVGFSTATHRFAGDAWTRLETTHFPRTELLVPTEFHGSLPVEQLVEAWGDYQGAVRAFNERKWQAEAPAREHARQTEQAHADALHEQRHVVDLLEEDI